MKKHRLSGLVIAILVGLAFSVSGAAQETTKPKTPAKPDSIKVVRANGVDEVPKGRTNDRYTIGFEDVLQINVYRHPELSQTVKVSRDGTILLPKIDQPITAVCKTERELASAITAFYRNYLRNPFVNVRALEQRSQPFFVIGAVNKPGPHFLNQRIRLLGLLALAGGPDYEQSGAVVQVARVGNLSACKANDDAPTSTAFFKYTLSRVMEGEENPYLQAGDIVSVLEAEEAYVVGVVNEPTTIKLKGPTTLTQAIAMAGGLGNVAKTDKIVLERRNPGSTEKQEMIYDLKDIASKKTPDPILRANDIVRVPTNNAKVVRNGILKAITGGIGNLFFRF